jgi:hypothetical protein
MTIGRFVHGKLPSYIDLVLQGPENREWPTPGRMLTAFSESPL